jgi:hypothetical protein
MIAVTSNERESRCSEFYTFVIALAGTSYHQRSNRRNTCVGRRQGSVFR